jgi:hypothetical protein
MKGPQHRPFHLRRITVAATRRIGPVVLAAVVSCLSLAIEAKAACTSDPTCPNSACQTGCRNPAGNCGFLNQPVGTACGDPSSSQCDAPDTCDGAGTCLANHVADNTSCDDNNACTRTDTCQSGVCMGTDVVVCQASDECHVAGVCNSASGVCSNPPADTGTPCGDPSSSECDAPDSCDGSGICQANHLPIGANCGDAGTECINQDTCDGNGACTDNGFKSSGAPCGNQSASQCDNPDSCDGAGTCLDRHVIDGTTCDDGDACTGKDLCQGGICAGGNPICGANAQCSIVPKSGCRKPVSAAGSVLVISDTTFNLADRLVWRWARGDATSTADFGDPRSSTGYRLCIYDQPAPNADPVEIWSASLPAGETWTRAMPAWNPLSTRGYLYRNLSLSDRGIMTMTLLGGPRGGSLIVVTALGSTLAPPAMPLMQSSKVIVQFNRIDDPNICWDANFSTPAVLNRDYQGAKGLEGLFYGISD